ncbi:hypothetical protein RhiirC2_717120 [Rhizophagus irregularis]|uniref:Uncharacterized protein n=1 Tax=Rhizophagus irregularis TaxID=588596 RepID=A0A2N1MNL6_9GLOM|nr:hypothetical protein RhiirC2_717120 [Rhizophagus irregularis]
MTKRKQISVEKQDQLRELAAKRQAENQQIAHELKIPIKEIEYCLDRAVVEMKKKKRRHSGFDLFKIDWFKKNQGYKAIDKHTSSLISYEWNAISLAEKNEYAEKARDMLSSNRTSTKKLLLPELGLETVVFTESKLPGDSYAGMPNTTIENPKKNKTLARVYVTKSLNELYIKAGGIGKIQFKNWENQKMEVNDKESPFVKGWWHGIGINNYESLLEFSQGFNFGSNQVILKDKASENLYLNQYEDKQSNILTLPLPLFEENELNIEANIYNFILQSMEKNFWCHNEEYLKEISEIQFTSNILYDIFNHIFYFLNKNLKVQLGDKMNLGSQNRKHLSNQLFNNKNNSDYGRKSDFFVKDNQNNVFLLAEVTGPPYKRKPKKELFDYGRNHRNGKDELEYHNLSIIYKYGPSLTEEHIEKLMKVINIFLLQIHKKNYRLL